MNPLALVPLRWWLTLGAAAIAVLALWSWGQLKHQQGVQETVAKYEHDALQQREINAKASFRAAERAAEGQKTFVERETVRETVYVKDKAAVADVWRYADRLRDELARRGATPIEATAACGAEQRRLREAENLIGEHTDALAACASAAVEGRDLAQRLDNKLKLARDYIDALP